MKLSTVAMFGAGYVLGTRAGHQRYEQLREAARRVAGEIDASQHPQRAGDSDDPARAVRRCA